MISCSYLLGYVGSYFMRGLISVMESKSQLGRLVINHRVFVGYAQVSKDYQEVDGYIKCRSRSFSRHNAYPLYVIGASVLWVWNRFTAYTCQRSSVSVYRVGQWDALTPGLYRGFIGIIDVGHRSVGRCAPSVGCWMVGTECRTRFASCPGGIGG